MARKCRLCKKEPIESGRQIEINGKVYCLDCFQKTGREALKDENTY
jgi:hypothetical protein